MSLYNYLQFQLSKTELPRDEKINLYHKLLGDADYIHRKEKEKAKKELLYSTPLSIASLGTSSLYQRLTNNFMKSLPFLTLTYVASSFVEMFSNKDPWGNSVKKRAKFTAYGLGMLYALGFVFSLFSGSFERTTSFMLSIGSFSNLLKSVFNRRKLKGPAKELKEYCDKFMTRIGLEDCL